MSRVHNHGPAQGRGLDCAERLAGQCLVVIDPDDREQLERLSDAYGRMLDRDGPVGDEVDCLADALRSLITPPRPDEPTGLGAVVEDEEGRLWVHSPRDSRCDWHCQELGPTKWSTIPAVRVLSEGVQA